MKKFNLKFAFLALIVVAVSCSDDDEPRPVATATPAAQVISSGETTSVELTSTITGTTFSWTVVQAGVTGASLGSGSTIAQTLSVDGTETGTATYTVVPTANGVAGDAINVMVTVNLAKTTYLADVKPILTVSCAPCHVAGGTHPGKWDEYDPAKNKINSIINRVKRNPGEQGFMPLNGTKLSDEKIAILEKWLADGLLEE